MLLRKFAGAMEPEKCNFPSLSMILAQFERNLAEMTMGSARDSFWHLNEGPMLRWHSSIIFVLRGRQMGRKESKRHMKNTIQWFMHSLPTTHSVHFLKTHQFTRNCCCSPKLAAIFNNNENGASATLNCTLDRNFQHCSNKQSLGSRQVDDKRLN